MNSEIQNPSDIPEQENPKKKNYIENKDFLINEAPGLIREKSFEDGMMVVLGRLGIEVGNYDRKIYKILAAHEMLAKRALEISNTIDTDARPLLDAATDALIKFKDVDYGGWSHSVCHPIETYGQERCPSSFLDTESSREDLTKLVNESVARQKESSHDVGCSDRIVGPILLFNLKQAVTTNLEKPYSYKPESLKDPEYVDILKNNLDDKYSLDVKIFLSTDTPLEFCSRVINSGGKLPWRLLPSEQLELLGELKKHLPADVLNSYVQKIYHPNGKDITFDELQGNFSGFKEAKDVVKGVYVDVDDTLISNGKLNKSLVEKLEGLAVEGREIIVFTGGNVANAEDQLRRLGLPEKFLSIRSKSDYRSKILESLIDDTPPEYQGFGAKEYEHWY